MAYQSILEEVTPFLKNPLLKEAPSLTSQPFSCLGKRCRNKTSIRKFHRSISWNKQMTVQSLNEVELNSKIIKTEVCAICRSRKLKQITLIEALIMHHTLRKQNLFFIKKFRIYYYYLLKNFAFSAFPVVGLLCWFRNTCVKWRLNVLHWFSIHRIKLSQMCKSDFQYPIMKTQHLIWFAFVWSWWIY